MGFLTIFYKYIIQQYFTIAAPNTPPPHRRCRHFTWTVAAIAAGHLPLLTSSQLKLTSPILVQAATESPLLSDF